MHSDAALITTVVAGIAMVIGVLGTIIPVLPGSFTVAVAALIWGLVVQTTPGWIITAIIVALVGAGNLLNYLFAGKRISESGVTRRTLIIAGLVGLVGFFVIPVLGLPIGFIATLFLLELSRAGHTDKGRSEAWRRTVIALKAVGLGMLIEAGAALVGTTVFFVGLAVAHPLS